MNECKIIQGDCIEEMRKISENSVDAIVTDPPYGIGFMGKEWDNFKPSKIKECMAKDKRPKTQIASTRISNIAGTYDKSISGARKFQDFCEEWSKEALRILKPGGFMLVSCSTRMYHRMACGIEDAGFEIRDTIMWLYGSGFPKSLNIGKQIDKMQGNEREVIGEKVRGDVQKAKQGVTFAGADANKNNKDIFGYGKETLTKGNSEWEGWGTALKPACEPIVVARKPLSEKNVALNVLKWGTGGINIDECRIKHNEKLKETNRSGRANASVMSDKTCGFDNTKNTLASASPQGRFPANIILDEEVGKMLDEQTGDLKSGSMKKGMGGFGNGEKNCYGESDGAKESKEYNSSNGGASRFFYCAKASKSERNLGCEDMEQKDSRKEDGSSQSLEIFSNQYTESSGNPTGRGITSKRANNHPTVKPIKLMEYLVKLISREGAVVLDPFLGSGTTAIACLKLNRSFIGIEKEEEYIKIINARIKPFFDEEDIK